MLYKSTQKLSVHHDWLSFFSVPLWAPYFIVLSATSARTAANVNHYIFLKPLICF